MVQGIEFVEDGIGGLGPAEGLRVVVVLADVAVDCGLQIDERKAPRRMRLRVSAEKKVSTAFSQDALVGVSGRSSADGDLGMLLVTFDPQPSLGIG
jgi:hypothetical protein